MPNKKQTIIKLFLLAIFCLAFLSMAGEARAAVIDRSFDTGDLSQWPNPGIDPFPCPADNSRLTVVTNPVREGTHSLRVLANEWGCWNKPGEYNDMQERRTEIATHTGESENVIRYYAISFYIPSSYDATSPSWDILTQWHGSSGGHSNVAVQYDSGFIRILTCGGPVDGSNKCINDLSTRINSDMKFKVNGWTDFIFKMTWSSNNAIGRTEVWVKYDTDLSFTLTPTYSRNAANLLRPPDNHIGNYQVGSYRYGPLNPDLPIQTHYVDGVISGDLWSEVNYAESAFTPPVDTTLPTVAFSCPLPAAEYNVDRINITGTATDNVGVKEVQYRVNGGGWTLATGTTSWNATNVVISATDGENSTVEVRAVDTATPANFSASAFVTVKYVVVAVPPPAVCTKFVAKTGNDSNPGTEAQPWLTLTKSANTAVAGNTVCVKEGTYNERLIPKNSGTAGNYISFISITEHGAILDGTGIHIPYMEGLITIDSKSYINITGFKVQYATTDGVSNDRSKGGNGISLRGTKGTASYINIKNNYIYDTYCSGILIGGPVTYAVIDHNELTRGQHAPPGIWCNEGLSVGFENGNADQIIISDNHLHHDMRWYNPKAYGGEALHKCGTLAISGNITLCGGPGIFIKDGSHNVRVFGNEIDHIADYWDWGNGIAVEPVTGSVSNVSVYNNLVHDVNVAYQITSEGLSGRNGANFWNISFYNNIAYCADVVTCSDRARTAGEIKSRGAGGSTGIDGGRGGLKMEIKSGGVGKLGIRENSVSAGF